MENFILVREEETPNYYVAVAIDTGNMDSIESYLSGHPYTIPPSCKLVVYKKGKPVREFFPYESFGSIPTFVKRSAASSHLDTNTRPFWRLRERMLNIVQEQKEKSFRFWSI